MEAYQDVVNKGKRSKRPRSALDRSPIAPSPCNSGDLTDEDLEEDMANCLILLARGQTTPSEVYRCKTCSKGFPSFQALGGHRASHKKLLLNKSLIQEDHQKLLITQFTTADTIKPESFRSKSGADYGTALSLHVSGGQTSKLRIHECSICGAEFGSGQALGGHMRRHRSIPTQYPGKKARNLLSLDLNLPAPVGKEQVIIFTASSQLVDCHY